MVQFDGATSEGVIRFGLGTLMCPMGGCNESCSVRLDVDLCVSRLTGVASCLADPEILLICGSCCGIGSQVTVVDLSCYGHRRAAYEGTGLNGCHTLWWNGITRCRVW